MSAHVTPLFKTNWWLPIYHRGNAKGLLWSVPPHLISGLFSLHYSHCSFCSHSSSCFSWKLQGLFPPLLATPPAGILFTRYLLAYLPAGVFVQAPSPPFSMRSILTTLFNSANCTKPSGNTTAFILFYIFPYCVYDFHLSFLEYRHLETRGLSILCIDLSQEIRTASGRLAHGKQWYIFSHKFCVYKWMTKLLQISYMTFVFHKHTWACISVSTHSHFFKGKRRNLNHFVCLFIKKEKRGWILGPWNKTSTALVCSGLLVCDCNFVVLIVLDELKSKFSLDCF